jgi:hypothetical protein
MMRLMITVLVAERILAADFDGRRSCRIVDESVLGRSEQNRMASGFLANCDI